MLGRAPPSKDGAAIEAILVDEWVKGLLKRRQGG